ncbi:MAG: TIGR04084 family radical SAM/SPASM domain-containing protein [Thermoplasmata archaeon]
MLYIVTTTGRCNLKCRYCGGSFREDIVPYDVRYDIDALSNIINRDADATVVYYGGEPLLNSEFIRRLNSRIKDKRIGIQTNGTLVRNFDEDFWNAFDFALLSVDGREEINDLNRGRGVYRKVIESAGYLKSFGIETIARMTVTEYTDIYEDVMHLYGLGLFDRIHWQLDVVWDGRWDLLKFAESSYLPGLRRLMKEFMHNASRGDIMGIVPFLGILSAYYFEPYTHYPCGAGQGSITVNTDGRVLACPIAAEYTWNNLGNLYNFRRISSPDCSGCEYFRYCGGRCLFSYMERYWGEEGFREICEVTRRTVDIVLENVKDLDELIGRGTIKREDLRYDPLKDSTEVIP